MDLFFGTVAVATAIAVPCALLLNKDDKMVLDSNIVYVQSGSDWADGSSESDFIYNYLYKDLNIWLSQQDNNINFLYYDSKEGTDKKNNNEFKWI